MAQVGDVFRSGQVVPVSGEYQYVAHVNPTWCTPEPEERRLTLKKGKLFPSHTCLRWVEWRLVRPQPDGTGETAGESGRR